ncbi:hypothetical protein [Kitasatospora cineracea]|uniref:Uncharacterized protein n=1 Tax=Kitasatospora cineracea TaxID=88074 RepID=A0A8G1UK29_9ACTN|nr:hypothetical protein [Kitasatospora cineracea]ROR45315.1 hypothetical protein EDD39_3540 [Kitasatospora cineracea]
MGFTGHLIVFRAGSAELPEVPEPAEVLPCPGGWHVLTDYGTAAPAPPDDLAARLAGRTAAPALVARVLHGDRSEIHGCLPGGPAWMFEQAVHLVVEQAVRERFGCEQDDEGLSAEEWQECVDEVTAEWEQQRAEALGHALARARAAGLPCDPRQVELAVESDELYAEHAAWDLLRALGVPVPPS